MQGRFCKQYLYLREYWRYPRKIAMVQSVKYILSLLLLQEAQAFRPCKYLCCWEIGGVGLIVAVICRYIFQNPDISLILTETHIADRYLTSSLEETVLLQPKLCIPDILYVCMNLSHTFSNLFSIPLNFETAFPLLRTRGMWLGARAVWSAVSAWFFSGQARVGRLIVISFYRISRREESSFLDISMG